MPRENIKFELRGTVFEVQSVMARQACDVLARRPRALQWVVRSKASSEIFHAFLSAIEGKPVEVTKENVDGLSELCSEFQCWSLSARIAAFKETPAYQIWRHHARLEALEKQMLLVVEFIDRTGQADAPAQKADVAAVGGAKKQKQKAAAAAPPVRGPSQRGVGFGSVIAPSLPEIFAEFGAKRFSLLWRGGSDGFAAQDFHRCCDGHANTLTLIEDTKGNIFGGFTPVEWDSRKWNGKTGVESNLWKADVNLKSFIFTLKNPHGLPARKFPLKPEKKALTIWCPSDWGPCFGDISVHDNCNANTYSFTSLGSSYTNSTGIEGKAFFTGSQNFTVNEIEVFEITD
jgi:hypothetical protein